VLKVGINALSQKNIGPHMPIHPITILVGTFLATNEPKNTKIEFMTPYDGNTY
jgi:hypothetical protein